MTNVLTSYDLHKIRNYQPLWDGLAKIGATRLLESLWVVTVAADVGQVRDALLGLLDNDDSVVVLELPVGASWSARSVRAGGAAWLTKFVRTY
jgi:hypothetical protein